MIVVAIIPARGGSKGVPRKNLRTVGGRSLVRRAVEAALDAATIDLVVVSTDDDEIADAAGAVGARVVRRPDELSGDVASSESAVLHALDALGRDPEVTVLVQATSPFLVAEDLDRVVAPLLEDAADCAFTVTGSHMFLWSRTPDGVRGVNHEIVPRRRRQDIDPEYSETGGAYAMRTSGLRSSGHRFFGRIELVEVPSSRSMEIDTEEDLELAETLASMLDRRRSTEALPDPIGCVVFDFDGVLTDDRVVTDQNGVEAVVSSRGDGMGIAMLRDAGVPMVVLSKERNPVTTARCTKLQLEVFQAVDDKLNLLRTLLTDRGLDPATVVYVGNDVNDLACIEFVGCGVAVGDAHPEVLATSDVILSRPGGRGAVRELAELVVQRLRQA